MSASTVHESPTFAPLPGAESHFGEGTIFGHFERFVLSSAVDQWGNLHIFREFCQDASWMPLQMLYMLGGSAIRGVEPSPSEDKM